MSVLARSDDAVSAGCRTQTSTFIDGSTRFQNESVSALRGSFQTHGSSPSNCAMIDCASVVRSLLLYEPLVGLPPQRSGDLGGVARWELAAEGGTDVRGGFAAACGLRL